MGIDIFLVDAGVAARSVFGEAAFDWRVFAGGDVMPFIPGMPGIARFDRRAESARAVESRACLLVPRADWARMTPAERPSQVVASSTARANTLPRTRCFVFNGNITHLR